MKAIKKHVNLLGYEAEDKVTELKGVITSISFDLYGCVQALLVPKSSDNKECGWFDITRLTLLSDKRVMDIPEYDKGYIAEGKKGAENKPLI